jgi:imidazolonepropionase-like amidohydrolase
MADAEGLLEAGVDAFAHGVRDRDIDDGFLALIATRGDLFLVPNLPDRGVATDLGWLAGTIPADELAGLQAQAVDRPDAQDTFGIQARNLARMNAAGVRIAFGTDGSTPWAAHVEMEDMVASGMTPAEVIVAATATSAELLRMDDAGTIEGGRSADFVVLDADPLADITNTRRISDVYLGGSRVDRDRLGARLGGEP